MEREQNRTIGDPPPKDILRRARDLPAIRADVVSRIRAEIERGTYITASKVETAIDRLLSELCPAALRR